MSTLLYLPFNNDYPIPNFILDQAHGFVGTPSGTAALSTAQKKYGDASLALGTSTANKVSFGSNTAWALGGSPFTISFWVYLTAYNSGGGALLSSTGGNMAWNSTDGYQWTVQSTPSGVHLVWWDGSNAALATVTVSLNTWTHIEFGYDGSTLYPFCNGTRGTSVATTVVAPSSVPTLMFGSAYGLGDTTTYAFNGYIDDFLIDAGSCLHTSDFTPAAIIYTPTALSAHTTDSQSRLAGDPVPVSSYSSIATQVSRDTFYEGRGVITATVKIKGSPDVPVARRVKLHETLSGNLVRETWSDTAGNYTFTGIDPANTYYAVAFDHTGVYQGVVADKLTPTVF